MLKLFVIQTKNQTKFLNQFARALMQFCVVRFRILGKDSFFAQQQIEQEIDSTRNADTTTNKYFLTQPARVGHEK